MQKVIETHFHILNDDEFHLIWLEGIPQLSNMSLEEDYEAAWRGQERYEVIGSLHVETDTQQQDKDKEAEFFINMVKNPDSFVKGICIFCDMLEGDAKSYLQRFVNEPAVKSVRYVLHNPWQLPGTCLQPKFIENVKALGEMNVMFEGCLRAQELDDFYQLVKQCPDTKFVLEHMGLVDISAWNDPAKKDYVEKYKKDMADIAALPNVVVKVSGLSSADVDVISDAVDYCLDIFGEDRVMYASNFPVCKCNMSLNDWTFAMLDITQKRGREFQDKFFCQNALRIYSL